MSLFRPSTHYEFEFISGCEYSLILEYCEKTKFFDLVLKSSLKKLNINKEKKEVNEIEVPKEYFNYIKNAVSKPIKDSTNIVQKEYEKQKGKQLIIQTNNIGKAKFTRIDGNTWKVVVETKGLYRIK